MGWIESGWEEPSQRLRVALEPYREGEELVGVVHANEPASSRRSSSRSE